MELYKRIRMRREELGMSQQELAKRLGYKSRSSVNKIELGENDIPRSRISDFASVLQTSEAWLMGFENNHPYQQEVDKLYAFECQLKVLGWSYKVMVEGDLKKDKHPTTYALFEKEGVPFKVSEDDFDLLVNDSLEFLNKRLQNLFEKYTNGLFDSRYYADAANAINNALPEDKQHDEDIMDDDNF